MGIPWILSKLRYAVKLLAIVEFRRLDSFGQREVERGGYKWRSDMGPL